MWLLIHAGQIHTLFYFLVVWFQSILPISFGINSLVPEKSGCNCKIRFSILFNWLILRSSHSNNNNAFRWMPQDLTDDKSTLFQVMLSAFRQQAIYLCQCWHSSTSPYGITRPQWFNSLWPSDAIWRQRSGSILDQVMACCLMALSHYLNQCWLIISEVQWRSY